MSDAPSASVTLSPPRVPRPLLIALIAVSAVVGLVWLVWAALFHSTPAVAGQMSGFRVVSDTEIVVTLTVDRRDPAQPVTCRVLAQGADFDPVGEQQVQVPGASARVVNTEVRLSRSGGRLTASVKGVKFPETARRVLIPLTDVRERDPDRLVDPGGLRQAAA